jgi:hypothetical protein
MYSFDTNVFMDWWIRRYPPDVFPCVQKAMESLAASGKLFSPSRVYDEINQIGPRGLQQWARKNNNIFVPHDSQLQTEATTIQFSYPDLIDNTSPHDEADRWIIALAKIKGFTVVTHETSVHKKKNPPRKMFIPDVCTAMGIKCIEFLELLRIEKYVF